MHARHQVTHNRTPDQPRLNRGSTPVQFPTVGSVDRTVKTATASPWTGYTHLLQCASDGYTGIIVRLAQLQPAGQNRAGPAATSICDLLQRGRRCDGTTGGTGRQSQTPRHDSKGHANERRGRNTLATRGSPTWAAYTLQLQVVRPHSLNEPTAPSAVRHCKDPALESGQLASVAHRTLSSLSHQATASTAEDVPRLPLSLSNKAIYTGLLQHAVCAGQHGTAGRHGQLGYSQDPQRRPHTADTMGELHAVRFECRRAHTHAESVDSAVCLAGATTYKRTIQSILTAIGGPKGTPTAFQTAGATKALGSRSDRQNLQVNT